MTTFGQIVYMVLDMMKELHDDAYYTEEHIIFLASKMRALLLERKYKNSRNQTFTEMSDENTQEICLHLEPNEMSPAGCSGMWLRSIEEIPDTIGVSNAKISTVSDMLQCTVAFIPKERMPYVGYNKWLKKILYAAKSDDGHLYVTGSNPQFMYLSNLKMSAVFTDPQKAAELSCDGDGAGKCNILEMEFPLEQALIPSCIELTVQELMGSRYAPQDKQNDAKDGLADVSVTQQRHPRPVENSSYKPRQQEVEE
jgi:hypothetical protein